MNNPNLLLDETFLAMSLSISTQDPQPLLAHKTLGKKKGVNITNSIGSSSDSINFDFSKKNLEDAKLKEMIKEEVS